MSDELAIEARGLTRDFGALRALDGLELEVRPGEIFGFLGPNGAGKTTTIRLLLGLLEPTGGSARVAGFDLATAGSRARAVCGALLENPGLYERLTAYENLDYYGRINLLSAGERQARIRELLDHLGLWERRADQIGGWSRGMRQKLAVARALLHRPRVVFLDEPTAGLDPVAAVDLREQLAGPLRPGGGDHFPHHPHPARGGEALPPGGGDRRREAAGGGAAGSPAAGGRWSAGDHRGRGLLA